MTDTAPVYLGDGLYAVINNGHVELRANSYEDPSDVVYLDMKTLEAFLEWIKSITGVKTL